MLIRALAAAALLVSTTAQPARAPRQPTGKWIVHFDDAQCVAERNYGSEDKPLYLALKQPALGKVIQIDLVERGYSNDATQFDGTVQFDGAAPRKVSVLRFPVSKEKMRIHMINIPLDVVSESRAATAVWIKSAYLDENFALQQFGPLLDIMNECAADLGKLWNVKSSDTDESAIRDDAKGNIRGLFSSDDYPMQSVRAGDTGRVKTALLVDEQGKVADCSVIETSGQAALDAQTCAVLKERARFKPAVGADGKPARDSWIQTIVWQLR